jgi:hypothetical protein
MRWIAFALLLLVVRPAVAVETVVLREAFDQVAFGSGTRDKLLRIEEREVRIEVYGGATAERLTLLSALAAELAALTGMAIEVTAAAGPQPPLADPPAGVALLQIHIVEPSYFPELLAQSWIPSGIRSSHARQLCSFVTRGRETIRGSLILVNATMAEATIRHCLVEETAQSFGAIDDTRLLDPSAFNDWGTLVDRLQPDDRRILKALYDARLHAGLTRAEVLPLLPELLED